LKSAPIQDGGRVIASPLAKKLASQRGIELSSVSGTGPKGRIVKADVDGYQPPKTAADTLASASPASAPARPVAAIEGAEYEDIPLTNMRKVIATRLQESKNTIPHYYLTSEIVMDKVLKLREVLNAQGQGQFKLSVNDFVIKAAAMALKQVPEVNSQWTGQAIRRYKSVDISVAVSTPSGLITPIIKAPDSKGLSQISNNMKELAIRARDNKLAPHEYQVRLA
jgi:pyruvate dehydrogenase E2 component (dihydrolipoamide acetyltransferase)